MATAAKGGIGFSKLEEERLRRAHIVCTRVCIQLRRNVFGPYSSHVRHRRRAKT